MKNVMLFIKLKSMMVFHRLMPRFTRHRVEQSIKASPLCDNKPLGKDDVAVVPQVTLMDNNENGKELRKKVSEAIRSNDLSGQSHNSEGGFRIIKSYGSEGFDTTLPWVIKNMIPATSVGIMYGRSQSFKTFCLIDICCRLSLGMPYAGVGTKQGLVFFIAAEGNTGISKRIRAWEKANGRVVGTNFIVIPHSVFPVTPMQKQALIAEIKNESHKQNRIVALVIFDTLSQCSNGMDENDAGHSSAYVNACKIIATSTNATVINVHHTKKTGGEFRGSSTFEGNVDFMISVKRDEKSAENKTLLSLHKMKEGSTEYKWNVQLEEIEIDALDDDGLFIKTLCINSCVMSQDNESHNTSDSKENKGQRANDANLIINILQKRQHSPMTLKELRLAMVTENTDLQQINASSLSVRLGRAKEYLEAQNIVYSVKVGREQQLSLINTVSDDNVA